MPGFLFQYSPLTPINETAFKRELKRIAFHPDAILHTQFPPDHQVAYGQVSWRIGSSSARSPGICFSKDERYALLFEGHIENTSELSHAHQLFLSGDAPQELILELYRLKGPAAFSLLQGAYALVLYDNTTHACLMARDPLGMIPLYFASEDGHFLASTQASAIASILQKAPSQTSIQEWKLIRRPLPGHSFFEDIHEVLPGSVQDQERSYPHSWSWEKWDKPATPFSQSHFEALLLKGTQNARAQSDTSAVSLLSGGLDSAIITALSEVPHAYSVGLQEKNEFPGAKDSADHLGVALSCLELDQSALEAHWATLLEMRQEPLSLPNEGLIFHALQKIPTHEHVIFTGEGADELLFGYDRIFRWALHQNHLDLKDFLHRYAYSDLPPTERLLSYLKALQENKSPIEFLEDFFLQCHLPGLLARMYYPATACQKRASMPFLDLELVAYLYRQSPHEKINALQSKLPIRQLAQKLSLTGALQRKKVGFIAKADETLTRQQEYAHFQAHNMEVLGWS